VPAPRRHRHVHGQHHRPIGVASAARPMGTGPRRRALRAPRRDLRVPPPRRSAHAGLATRGEVAPACRRLGSGHRLLLPGGVPDDVAGHARTSGGRRLVLDVVRRGRGLLHASALQRPTVPKRE